MVLLLQSLILGNEKLQMIAAFQSEEWEAKNKKKLMSFLFFTFQHNTLNNTRKEKYKG